MATKRMFDKAIIDTDKFMDLPMPSKALYFLLGMESDDEGFVSYKKVMRIHGGNEDDIKILAAKGFIIPFPTGVVVITDWNKNNWLDSRRIKPTEYQKEKQLLTLDKNNKYVLSGCLASIEENRVEQKRIEEKRETKESRFAPPSLEEVSNYCLERKNGINAQSFIDFYSSKGWLIGKNKMRDWRAAIRTWESRNKPSVLKGDPNKYDKFD